MLHDTLDLKLNVKWIFHSNVHGEVTPLSIWTPCANQKKNIFLHKASPKWVKILSMFFHE